MTPETYAALSAESGLTLKASDDQRVIDRLRDEREHYRRMYVAAFRAAMDKQEIVRKQQETIRELREVIRRCACAVFPVETRE